jgi:hypothetical protein
MRKAVKFASRTGKMTFSPKAEKLWCDVYPKLSAEVPGLLGAVTARAEAQVLRLSLIYALLDSSKVINTPHLYAALEVWRYCFDSCRYIFGSALGDPVADGILRELRKNPKGLTRTEISKLLGHNLDHERISDALESLHKHERAFTRDDKGGKPGRPSERWFAKLKGQ